MIEEEAKKSSIAALKEIFLFFLCQKMDGRMKKKKEVATHPS
jgi:hypothetical protein